MNTENVQSKVNKQNAHSYETIQWHLPFILASTIPNAGRQIIVKQCNL